MALFVSDRNRIAEVCSGTAVRGVSEQEGGFDMRNVDAPAAAGIIWNWRTRSRALPSPTALLSSASQPFQVEPLLRGCGCTYPAAFFSPFSSAALLPSYLWKKIRLFSPTALHTNQTYTHLQSLWKLWAVTVWPAAESEQLFQLKSCLPQEENLCWWSTHWESAMHWRSPAEVDTEDWLLFLLLHMLLVLCLRVCLCFIEGMDATRHLPCKSLDFFRPLVEKWWSYLHVLSKFLRWFVRYFSNRKTHIRYTQRHR